MSNYPKLFFDIAIVFKGVFKNFQTKKVCFIPIWLKISKKVKRETSYQ